MKLSITALFVFVNILYCHAQQQSFGYHRDALRFTRTDYGLGSTARMQAIGGSQIALGGDVSAAGANPAGLGFFNKNVFSSTISIDFIDTDATYFEKTKEAFVNHFSFNNIGVVLNYSKGKYSDDKFKGGSVGITLSRKAGYKKEVFYEAANDFHSIVDSWATNAGQLPENELGGLELAAYEQYLITPKLESNGGIIQYNTEFDGFPIQKESIEESGSHYLINLAWGGNYNDVLYFGGGLALHSVEYRQKRKYTESNFAIFDEEGNGTPDPTIDQIKLEDDIDINGGGISLNAGLIFKPIHFVTLGVHYTSPTFFSLNDRSNFSLHTKWKPGTLFFSSEDTTDISSIEGYESDIIQSNYDLRTSSKVAIGGAIFAGKHGFITGDMEFVNYGTARLKSNDFSPSSDNQLIKELYKNVMNFRVGGEYRLDYFRLRAGYASFPSPYKNPDSHPEKQTKISFGVGYQTPEYNLGFTIVNSQFNEIYEPYTIPYTITDNPPEVAIKTNTTSVVLTFDLFF